MIVYNYDADLEVSDTCVRSSLLSWVSVRRAFTGLPTQTGPKFTWCWVSGYVGPRFCDVTHGLLQCHSLWGIHVHHRQAPASTECCHPCHCGSMTTDSAISCTSSCTGWAFLSGCSTGCVQWSIDVCSTKHHSTWSPWIIRSWTAASTPQTLLVGSMCGPLAAISCLYHKTDSQCSVVRPFL